MDPIKISFLLLITLYSVKAQTGCTPTYCGVNGVCEIQNNAPVCVCKQGFVGSRCQAVDPCGVRPCGANGACFPIITSQQIPGQVAPIEQVTYHCQCYSGFYGQNCEFAPALPCTSRPCLNNGICVNKNNTVDYYCICVGTYTGKDCGTYIDQCANNLCRNEAICIPSSDPSKNYTCSCKNGFYGEYCEIEINECEIVVNGLKTTPCQNNATCYDLVDAYYCECNGPFAGQNCETSLLIGTGDDINSLLPIIIPSVVSAALLPILPTALTLLILKTMNKGKDVNPCNANPCGQGSVCIPSGGSYVCQCAPGFFGSPCQPNPCASNPCKQPNSQCIPVEAGSLITNIPGCTCVNPVATYVCVCPSTNPPYASVLC